MKRIVLIMLILCIGICYAYDFPAGVPSDYFGVWISSSINLNIRHDIDINHPAIAALPHYDYLHGPMVIGLSGDGQADITITANGRYPLVSAYYGDLWHKAAPYELISNDDMVLTGVDFEAGSDVILLMCQNDPFLQVVYESFTAEYIETEPRRINVNWTTSSETGLSNFRVFHSISEDTEQIEYLGDVSPTNTELPASYSYDCLYPQLGYTHYFWLRAVDNLFIGDSYGPVSVSTGPPYIPQNKVSSVIPNPCNNEFWCVYEIQDSSLVSILLLDESNNVVKEIRHKESMPPGGHMLRCRVFDLPEGLYRIYFWFEQESGPFYAYGDVLIDRTEER